jgi:hypothetical protein
MATCAVILGLAALVAGPGSRAEDKKPAVDEKAMMEAMMKAATPGEQHKLLSGLAGSWDVKVTMWMDPTKPPTESKGTATSKMIMGGRYLEEKVTGEFGGMKFEGQSVTGYDNVQKKYLSSWIDNMGTGITNQSGSYDADKKTFTYEGEVIDPLTGKKTKMKTTQKLVDKDKYEVDMFRVEGGKEMKEMHLDYARTVAK